MAFPLNDPAELRAVVRLEATLVGSPPTLARLPNKLLPNCGRGGHWSGSPAHSARGARNRSPPSFGVLEKGLIRLPRLGLP